MPNPRSDHLDLPPVPPRPRGAATRGGGRDRDDRGRPEQQRPRDRTGRPLPHGTDDVPLTQEFEPETVEQALELGVWLWDRERFFEAHEALEHVWHAAPDEDRDFWQGVIQVAVVCVHHQRGNPDGVRLTGSKAAARLAAYPDVHHGVDVDQLRGFLDGVIDVVGRAGIVEIGYPIFPCMDDGPWFTEDGGPTPLDDAPPFETAARDRRRRRRTDEASR